MDSKFKSDGLWFVSSIVNLHEFLETAWTSECQLRALMGRPPSNVLIKEEEFHLSQMKKDFQAVFKCSEKTVKNIFDRELPTSRLINNNDLLMKREFDDINVKANLHPTFLRTHAHAEERNVYCNNPQKKSNYLRTLKYDRYDKGESHLQREMPDWSKNCAKDIVLMVSVLMPYNKILSGEELRSSRLMYPQTKFMLRGDSTLVSLRKKLSCVSDMIVPLKDGKELEAPDMTNSNLVKYPSSFIFINDTFYVDMSADNSEDISRPIRTFMSKKKCFDPVQAKDMDGVRIIDLSLRLGQPYVFQHSGTCEHLLIFHDLRLMHKLDEQDIERYPLLLFEKGGDVRCIACKSNFATFVVEDCERLPAASMMFCDECFREFHFAHGVKIGNFTANPYFQMNRLTFSV